MRRDPVSEPRPTDRARLGDRPHVHDFWDGQDQALLFDDWVEVMLFHNHFVDEPPREQHTHGCDGTIQSDSQGGSKRFSLPPGKTVYPGTAELDVNVAWEDPSITGLRLLYRPAGRGHEHGDDHGDVKSAAPGSEGYEDAGLITNGEPVRIPVAPMESDDGHALRSHWGFFLCAADGTALSVAEGSVHVTIVAHRSDPLPFDLPHPDRWGEGTALRIATGSLEGPVVTVANKGDDAFVRLQFGDDAIVPPDTSRLLVFANVTTASSLAQVDPGTVLLYVRDPTAPGWTYVIHNADSAGPAYRFEAPVESDQVDSPYATLSDWDIWFRVVSSTHKATPVGEQGAPYDFEGRLDAEAWVVRGVA